MGVIVDTDDILIAIDNLRDLVDILNDLVDILLVNRNTDVLGHSWKVLDSWKVARNAWMLLPCDAQYFRQIQTSIFSVRYLNKNTYLFFSLLKYIYLPPIISVTKPTPPTTDINTTTP